MSCRIHRIRLAAASGWSPNSWAIRLAQPAIPNRRTVCLDNLGQRLGGQGIRWLQPDANKATHRASFTVNRVMKSLPA